MPEKRVAERVPTILGKPGRALWRAIIADVREGFALDSRETMLLERACTTADHIAALEAVIASDGPTATGSRGQVIVHPALCELRQQKLTLLRLLGALDFGADAGEESLSSRRASNAAQSRWNRKANIEQRRAAARQKGGTDG